jgi:hypothetical protein
MQQPSVVSHKWKPRNAGPSTLFGPNSGQTSLRMTTVFMFAGTIQQWQVK